MEQLHDYYEILDVKPTATQAEIGQQYTELAKELDNGSDVKALKKWDRLTEAYEVLRNPDTRNAFDFFLGLRKRMTAEQWEKYNGDNAGEILGPLWHLPSQGRPDTTARSALNNAAQPRKIFEDKKPNMIGDNYIGFNKDGRQYVINLGEGHPFPFAARKDDGSSYRHMTPAEADQAMQIIKAELPAQQYSLVQKRLEELRQKIGSPSRSMPKNQIGSQR